MTEARTKTVECNWSRQGFIADHSRLSVLLELAAWIGAKKEARVKFIPDVPNIPGRARDPLGIFEYLKLLYKTDEEPRTLEENVLKRSKSGVIAFCDNSGEVRDFLNRANIPWGNIEIKETPERLRDRDDIHQIIDRRVAIPRIDMSDYEKEPALDHQKAIGESRVFFMSHDDSYYRINKFLISKGERDIPEISAPCPGLKSAILDNLLMACIERGITASPQEQTLEQMEAEFADRFEGVPLSGK